jgi:hypothetical protein
MLPRFPPVSELELSLVRGGYCRFFVECSEIGFEWMLKTNEVRQQLDYRRTSLKTLVEVAISRHKILLPQKRSLSIFEACLKTIANHQSSPIVLATLIHPANNPPMGVARFSNTLTLFGLCRITRQQRPISASITIFLQNSPIHLNFPSILRHHSQNKSNTRLAPRVNLT